MINSSDIKENLIYFGCPRVSSTLFNLISFFLYEQNEKLISPLVPGDFWKAACNYNGEDIIRELE